MIHCTKSEVLFKKDSKTDLSASKVFETVVPYQTKESLSLNKILYGHQYVFEKNHPTDTCLASFNDQTLNDFDDV